MLCRNCKRKIIPVNFPDHYRGCAKGKIPDKFIHKEIMERTEKTTLLGDSHRTIMVMQTVITDEYSSFVGKGTEGLLAIWNSHPQHNAVA